MAPTEDPSGPRRIPEEAFEPLGSVLGDLHVKDIQLDARLRALEAGLLPSGEYDRRLEKIHERVTRTDEHVSDLAVHSAKAQGRLRILLENQDKQSKLLDEILRRLPGDGGSGSSADGTGSPAGGPEGELAGVWSKAEVA